MTLYAGLHTCADVIQSVPLFDDAEEGFIASLVTMLRPQVCSFVMVTVFHCSVLHALHASSLKDTLGMKRMTTNAGTSKKLTTADPLLCALTVISEG